ncbi:hypothetical protein [uncultured Roseivirga sp.]|uniref:hypothetical protein n=1 Tax=uncultured Roseivirga sp. TaxID=543088 RepID=UPI0030DA0962|tara:strand:+ start:69897 stop:70298 length:402 start_codon:yes stop_codon:yes gene_type:complete
MNFTDPSHKKILGILFITFSALGLLGLVFYDFFMDFILNMAAMDNDPMPPEALWIFDFIDSILWGIAVVFLIPKIVIGFGLVNGRKWAMMPALVYGIIGLINFPVGTLVGVYSILIYTAKPQEQEESFERRTN